MGAIAPDVFAYGLAAGLSGTAFVATVLVLSTQRGPANATALLVGLWLVLLPAVVLAALLVDVVTRAGGEQLLLSLVQLALGLMLLSAAWRVRPGRTDGPDIAAKVEALAAKVQALEPAQAVRLGTGLGLLPKRLTITALAGAAIGAAGVSPAQGLLLAGLYLLVATSLVWGTLVAYLIGGRRASTRLEAGRRWVTANAQTLAFAVALLFGLLFTGQSLIDLVVA